MHQTRTKVFKAGRQAISTLVRRVSQARERDHKHAVMSSCEVWNYILADVLDLDCDGQVREMRSEWPVSLLGVLVLEV